jgi:hypothetical protein
MAAKPKPTDAPTDAPSEPALPTAIKLTASQAGFAPDANDSPVYYSFDAGAVIRDPSFIALFVGRGVAFDDVSGA